MVSKDHELSQRRQCTLLQLSRSTLHYRPKGESAENLAFMEGPGDPPAPDTTLETAPSETPAETDPMPRNSRRHRNAEVDFKGEKRSNATHASTTDPDARLGKKALGTGAALCLMGHALMENRNGLVVQGDLTQGDGHAERRWTWSTAIPPDRPGD